MKKLFLALALVGLLGLIVTSGGGVAFAASSVNIAITATGSEVNITCSENVWDVGIIQAGATDNTAINWATLTNDGGSEAVDVTIHGHDMTGGGLTWELADDGVGNTYSGSNGVIGMKCGLDDGDDLFDIVIKKNTTFNYIVEELATDASEDFGLWFQAPAAGYTGNEAMTMSDSGLTLTGSID